LNFGIYGAIGTGMIQSSDDILLMKLANPDEFKMLVEGEYGYPENPFVFQGFLEDKMPEDWWLPGEEYHNGRRFFGVFLVYAEDLFDWVTDDDDLSYAICHPYVLYLTGHESECGLIKRFKSKEDALLWISSLNGVMDRDYGFMALAAG